MPASTRARASPKAGTGRHSVNRRFVLDVLIGSPDSFPIRVPGARSGTGPSEEHRECRRDGRAVLAANVVAEGAADRRVVDVNDLQVEPVIAGVEGVEVQAGEVFGAVAESG